MPPIKGMLVDLLTDDETDSGTDDHIYIGFWGTDGGREFPLDVDHFDDFEPGLVRYILGGEPTTTPENVPVQRPAKSKPGEDNDPGRIPIERDSVQFVYLRKAGSTRAGDDDAYKLSLVRVLLYGLPDTGFRSFRLQLLGDGVDGLWFGNEFGQMAWLKEDAAPGLEIPGLEIPN
jgi:hypothetical protein